MRKSISESGARQFDLCTARDAVADDLDEQYQQHRRRRAGRRRRVARADLRQAREEGRGRRRRQGFAGIEAFCAFLAVATHRVCQPRQESLFERNAAG